MKLQAAIIDDEFHAREALADKLQVHCPEIEVVFQGGEPEDAIRFLSQDQVDLLFLDIVMPGKSGFELLECLPELSAEVIFVTAHNHYAIEAFQICALGYLLKPVETESLIKAVANVKNRLATSKNSSPGDSRLAELLQFHAAGTRKLAVPVANGYSFVPINEINRLEADGRYTLLFTAKRELISSKNLGYFSTILKGYQFFQTHKSHVVNLKQVESFNYEGEILLTDGTRIPLSRRRKQAFLRQFEG